MLKGDTIQTPTTTSQTRVTGMKIFLVVTMFLWLRATLPRYRYDQIMRLGWKVFIPLTLVWIAVVGVWMQTPWSLWR